MNFIDPFLANWPSRSSAFATDNCPVHSNEIDFTNWTDERFKGNETNSSGYPPQMIQTRGDVFILDACS